MVLCRIMISFFFHVILLGIAHSHSDEECKPPYERIGEGCYYISNDKVNGNEAFARCLKLGDYLVNMETLEEAMMLTSALIRKNTGVSYYVGGRNINRYLPKGDWRWIKNGKMIPMTYYIFGSDQPSSTKRHPQDCMFFYAPDKYNIHDIQCHSVGKDGGYICEKNIEGIKN